MSYMKTVVLQLAAIAVAGLFAFPAEALRMDQRNARNGCVNLVKAAHSDLKGKQRIDEIRKCKSDPDNYNKASGL